MDTSEIIYHGISTDSDGNLYIKLEPEDTELLPPGDYYYTVKVEHEDGSVETVLAKTKFMIID